MEQSESYRSGFQEREEVDLAEGVHIRQEDRGIMFYAVFDGDEQVSEEAGPMGEEYVINFAKGYSEAKRRLSDE